MTHAEAWGTSGPDYAPLWARQYYPTWQGPYNDQAIEGMIRHALDHDPHIPPHAQLHIQVDHGFVTLTGMVRNKWVKMAAEEDAWATPGVEDLNNFIEVHPRSGARSSSGPLQ